MGNEMANELVARGRECSQPKHWLPLTTALYPFTLGSQDSGLGRLGYRMIQDFLNSMKSKAGLMIIQNDCSLSRSIRVQIFHRRVNHIMLPPDLFRPGFVGETVA